MYVFIWPDLAHVSDRYHEYGGLVVIAASLDRAVGLAMDHGVQFVGDETFAHTTLRVDDAATEAVFVFPNAGCC